MHAPYLAIAITTSAILSAALCAEAEVPLGPAETVEFRKQSTELGDRSQLTLHVAMDLKTQSIQGGQVIEQGTSQTERNQVRTMVVTHLEEGRVVGARVRFDRSDRGRSGDSGPGVVEEDPVIGKAYDCRRVGDELEITSADGAIPPLAEYRVVAQAMESLGKPNPLANYLAGRLVAVGERLALPPEVAKAVFGMDDRFGEVERFELTLESIQSGDADSVARFTADAEASGAGSAQMRLQLIGSLAIDVGSCRVLRADLSGPIGMSESRGSLTNKRQLIGSGKVRMQIASQPLPQVR